MPPPRGDTRKVPDDMSTLTAYEHLTAHQNATSYPNVTPIRPRLEAVPAPSAPLEAAETRGFALYVGLDEGKAALDGTSLTELVTELRRLAASLAPHATTHAAVALAPRGAGGRDVDVVRTALGDPEALARRREPEPAAAPGIEGVTVDTTRRRVLVDGANVHATYTEFELLWALVAREGRAVGREELISLVWRTDDEAGDREQVLGERPSERTIDVHIRRLRGKLGEYADIIRTVRGQGYRFDEHADVEVLHAQARTRALA